MPTSCGFKITSRFIVKSMQVDVIREGGTTLVLQNFGAAFRGWLEIFQSAGIGKG
jgi:hypothetical protein